MRLTVALITVLCLACSKGSVPRDIIPPNKMTPLVFDIIRADEFVTDFVLRDTSLKEKEQRIKMYEQVFLVHHTTHDAFYKSFRYYQQHPDINKVLFDSLVSFGNRKLNLNYEQKYAPG